MDLKTVSLPSFRLVGMLYAGPIRGNSVPELWRQFAPRMAEIENPVNPEIGFGAQDHFNHAAGTFEYLAAIEVKAAGRIPHGMQSWVIPAQTYAVFPASLSIFSQDYEKAYGEALPAAGLERGDGPEFERYDEDFEPGNPTSPFALYIPIRPSQAGKGDNSEAAT
jgi:AraC family transcriptional regulator